MLIGDEMGVGKTIQSLAIAYIYRFEWPLLIVCPSALKLNWFDETLRWIPKLSPDDIQMIDTGKDAINMNCCVFITSYEMATTRIKEFDECNF